MSATAAHAGGSSSAAGPSPLQTTSNSSGEGSEQVFIAGTQPTAAAEPAGAAPQRAAAEPTPEECMAQFVFFLAHLTDEQICELSTRVSDDQIRRVHALRCVDPEAVRRAGGLNPKR